MIGYDIEEYDRNYDKQGITGEVTRYSTGSMQYPCYIVHAPFERYKVTVLKTMFNQSGELEEGTIGLYFSNGGNLIEMGKLLPRQVNAFLKLFSDNKVECFYDKDKELKGDLLYTLGGL